jgi:hypothetical protein
MNGLLNGYGRHIPISINGLSHLMCALVNEYLGALARQCAQSTRGLRALTLVQWRNAA